MPNRSLIGLLLQVRRRKPSLRLRRGRPRQERSPRQLVFIGSRALASLVIRVDFSMWTLDHCRNKRSRQWYKRRRFRSGQSRSTKPNPLDRSAGSRWRSLQTAQALHVKKARVPTPIAMAHDVAAALRNAMELEHQGTWRFQRTHSCGVGAIWKGQGLLRR